MGVSELGIRQHFTTNFNVRSPFESAHEDCCCIHKEVRVVVRKTSRYIISSINTTLYYFVRESTLCALYAIKRVDLQEPLDSTCIRKPIWI